MNVKIFTRITAFLIILFALAQLKYCPQPRTNYSFLLNDSLTVHTDLDKIRERGKLIALTDNSTTSYFVYKGEPMGFEYELLDRFARSIGVRLEIVVASDLDSVMVLLNRGKADIIAANLTVTSERMEKVNFTSPLLFTRQVLVQRKPEKWRSMAPASLEKALVRNVNDLEGKKVCTRGQSAFLTRLKNIEAETGIDIDITEAPGEFDTEQLIRMVNDGQIDYTVADENVALINQTYYPNIDVRTAISFPQRIAWAVRRNSPELLQAINGWLDKAKPTAEFAYIYAKYFLSAKEAGLRNESEYFSKTGGKISPYDDLIKECAKRIGWDWRLLASMVYEESRFQPNLRSWAGAYGLMQIIPATSAFYGIDSLNATPAESMRAGCMHIMRIDNYWKQFITDSIERIKFDLASYNVGLGHIIDARALAVKYSRNPDLWENNVAYFLGQKSSPKYYSDPLCRFGYCRGDEPCKYVAEILDRYDHYCNVIEVRQHEIRMAQKY